MLLVDDLAGAHRGIPVVAVGLPEVPGVQLEGLGLERLFQPLFIIEDARAVMDVASDDLLAHRGVVLREQDVLVPERVQLERDRDELPGVRRTHGDVLLVLCLHIVDLGLCVHAGLDEVLLHGTHIPILHPLQEHLNRGSGRSQTHHSRRRA